MKEIVDKLISLGKTISTMESCTGGAVSNAITNVEGSSEVLKFSAVTYSNEYKIKMGVDASIIDKYSVYSIEVAKEMSKVISLYTNSNYGIGITGKLNRIDKNNLSGLDNQVFVSIYCSDFDTYTTFSIEVFDQSREKNKEFVVLEIIKKLSDVIK